MKEHFVGTWKLTNWELQTSSGAVHSYPYGRDAIGTLIYTDATYMSANLMVKDRSPFEHPNPLKATDKEIWLPSPVSLPTQGLSASLTNKLFII